MMIARGYSSHVGEPRSRVVAFSRGYHGSTLMARTLSGLPHVGHPFAVPLRMTNVELPVPPRELRRPESLQLLLSAFEQALDADPDDRPLAVVVEPFLNVGGGIVLPTGFLAGLQARCQAAGALLIVDEVFTGYGRTGKMFAFQHEDAEPDIVVSSKGLASGYLPIAAVTVQQRIYDSFKREPLIGGLRYGHTTSGHAVACAAALATLDLLEKDHLVAGAERLGAMLRERLAPIAGLPEVIDLRGVGLLAVVETADPEAASAIHARVEEAGLLLWLLGPSVMAVPPLTIDEGGIATVADLLLQATATAGR